MTGKFEFQNLILILSILLLSFRGVSVVKSKTIFKTFDIHYVTNQGQPDGVKARPILTANGQFPGPLIECEEGDTLHIKVINNMVATEVTQNFEGTEAGVAQSNITIHWHGILQKNSQFNDGVEKVTQCAIPFGQSMEYIFTVRQFGTYWWHAHTFTHYTEGLYGPLIIHPKMKNSEHSGSPYYPPPPPPPPYGVTSNYYGNLTGYPPNKNYGPPANENYCPAPTIPLIPTDQSHEIIILLSDWNHLTGLDITAWFLSPLSGGNEPIPDSDLINGRGTYPCPIALGNGLKCDPILQRPPKFWVTKGQTYRFRIISAAAFANYEFSIDQHTFNVIESDGNLVAPNSQECQVFTIAPAQRLSFLVKMDEQSKGNRFWIRAKVLKDAFPEGVNINENPEALADETRAILIYEDGDEMQEKILKKFPFQYRPVLTIENDDGQIQDDSDTLLPETEKGTNLLELNEASLSYVCPAPQPLAGDAIVFIYLILSPETDENDVVHLNFNGDTYETVDGDKPLLVKVFQGEALPPSVEPTWVPLKKVVQIVVNNIDGGSHPLHLHGHFFWVMGAGEEGDGFYNGSKLNDYGLARDTAMVEAESWLVIRFWTNNPGVWLFHCHIQWHAVGGLTLAIIEGQDELRETLRITDETRRICRATGTEL